MASMLARASLLFFALVAIPGHAFAQDRSDACGYVYPIAGYRADIAGLQIVLPENDRLIVNGQLVAEHTRYDEGPTPTPWQDSANSAQVAQAGNYVLIRTEWTDCVDYSWSRIYVLDRSGALVATNALWSLNDEFSSFSTDPSGLMFSSSWFCGERSGAPLGRAFVYILRRGAGAFQREDRAWDDVCSPEARHRIGSLYFADMQPILVARD
ncbi:MAG: hypothetical protein K2P70_17770 [Hyphomonadaceae bacterium]|nr:hypothetical protein [Hyphomonadaceae bacterium]